MRTINADELARAIEFGGYPIARRYFFRSHIEVDDHLKSDEELRELPPADLIEACALGIGALNLGVGPHALYNALMEVDSVRTLNIFSMNDKAPTKSLTQIARYVRKSFKGMALQVEEFDFGDIFNNYQGKKV